MSKDEIMIIVEKDQIVRQGDVLLVPVEEIPEDAELVSQGSELTIAYGEATGHHHTLYPQRGVLAKECLVKEFKTKSGRRFVEFNQVMNLRHPDHDPAVDYKLLKPCIREIIIEEQENPFLDEITRVKD